MAGIFLQHEGALLLLTEAPYATEALLQELVAQHPETLSGDREAYGRPARACANVTIRRRSSS